MHAPMTSLERRSGAAPAASAAFATPAWYGAMSNQVIGFFHQLRRIPIEAWYRFADADPHVAGDERPRDSSLTPAIQLLLESQADQMARARLREVMETMPGVVQRIRRRIDDELAVIDGIAPPAAVARMRRAARLAACAVAARPFLSPAEFERLYRPFRMLIPPTAIAAR